MVKFIKSFGNKKAGGTYSLPNAVAKILTKKGYCVPEGEQSKKEKPVKKKKKK
jgi:hypothetical protein